MDDANRPLDEQTRSGEEQLDWNDPLPDVPQAPDGSLPVTSPYPIDFSTDGVTAAGAVGMGTLNDDNDERLFERTVDALEESGADSPMLGDSEEDTTYRRARIYRNT
jgi:hypothetical protein